MTDTTHHKFKVAWAKNADVEVSSLSELDDSLNALDRQARESQPLIADLVHPDGPVLTMGLGLDRSALNYSASDDPPYFTSYNPDGDEDETVVFYYYDHESPFNGDQAVPMDDAREAARRFMASGQRPDNIEWTMD